MSNGWIKFLKGIAWVNLIVSIIAAICIFDEFGEAAITASKYYKYTTTEANWTAIGIGIGLIFESFLVLAFFMAIAYIAEQAENTNYYLDKIERISRNFAVPKDNGKWQCPDCFYTNKNESDICEKCNCIKPED